MVGDASVAVKALWSVERCFLVASGHQSDDITRRDRDFTLRPRSFKSQTQPCPDQHLDRRAFPVLGNKPQLQTSKKQLQFPSYWTQQTEIRMNRALSIRSKKSNAGEKSAPKHRFTMASLRGTQQPELSKKLFKIIKSENHAIGAYEAAARERVGIAQQLSEWGESTEDETISEISDKLGVLLAEIAEQEDLYAQALEEYRGILKQIRNTESSVQPSRDHKIKVSDEIAKLKYKEPQSTKIVQLEQELVRAEAQSLVAEAQLSNITRQKFKEAYDHQFAATIERAEKQIILAKHARRLLNLVDDTPIVPGDVHPSFTEVEAARQVLTDAEDDLRNYRLDIEPIPSNAGNLGVGAMPGVASPTSTSVADQTNYDNTTTTTTTGSVADEGQYDTSGSAAHPLEEADRVERLEQAQVQAPVAHVA
ncbi:hypothetical protein NX059_005902 [Plenodomus lindquistii]|nr:hypothetical protein NX059_005902 [Plenodomus lindquistii]